MIAPFFVSNCEKSTGEGISFKRLATPFESINCLSACSMLREISLCMYFTNSGFRGATPNVGENPFVCEKAVVVPGAGIVLLASPTPWSMAILNIKARHDLWTSFFRTIKELFQFGSDN